MLHAYQESFAAAGRLSGNSAHAAATTDAATAVLLCALFAAAAAALEGLIAAAAATDCATAAPTAAAAAVAGSAGELGELGAGLLARATSWDVTSWAAVLDLVVLINAAALQKRRYAIIGRLHITNNSMLKLSSLQPKQR